MPCDRAHPPLSSPFHQHLGPGRRPASFAAIIIGCLVAQFMHAPSTYPRLRPLTGTAVTTMILVLPAVEGATLEQRDGPHVLFAALVALALPACLTGPRRLRAVLGSRPLVYVGTRAYTLYLGRRVVAHRAERRETANARGRHRPERLAPPAAASPSAAALPSAAASPPAGGVMLPGSSPSPWARDLTGRLRPQERCAARSFRAA